MEKRGYVFDGYLSTLEPFFNKTVLLEKFSETSIGYYKQMTIYTNGVSCHMQAYGGGHIIKYIVPDATLEEGFLVSNHLFGIERQYAAALQDKNGHIDMSVGKDRFCYEFECEVEGRSDLGSISITEFNNTIIILSIIAD